MTCERNLPEYGKIVAVAIETLILFCDDEDSDVRLVAGDSINYIIKVSNYYVVICAGDLPCKIS